MHKTSDNGSSIQMEINKFKSDKMNVFCFVLLWIRWGDKHFHLMVFYDSDDYIPFGNGIEGDIFICAKQNGDRIHLVFNVFDMMFWGHNRDACRR